MNPKFKLGLFWNESHPFFIMPQYHQKAYTIQNHLGGHLGRKLELIRASNYSWIGRLDIVRMPILPKLSSKFNEIAINIPTGGQK